MAHLKQNTRYISWLIYSRIHNTYRSLEICTNDKYIAQTNAFDKYVAFDRYIIHEKLLTSILPVVTYRYTY